MEKTKRKTAMAEETYQETIARMRQERANREHLNRLDNIQADYRAAVRERDEAAARGDIDEFEMRDSDCERLEQDWQYLNPPRPPQLDPRLVQFAKQNAGFLQKYGQRAYQALDAAHAYMIRPRTGSTNPAHAGMGWNPQHVFTPQYFDRMRDLLELHGEKLLGVKYDRGEELLTPNEAAKISGLSPQQYNHAVRAMASQG